MFRTVQWTFSNRSMKFALAQIGQKMRRQFPPTRFLPVGTTGIFWPSRPENWQELAAEKMRMESSGNTV
jgi:hypothetical protein